MNKELLSQYGIDYQKGLVRCLNDESFYAEILGLFLTDDAFARAKAAYENNDYQQLFKCTHEMKGSCGNAEITELYNAICPLVEALRNNSGTKDEVDRLFYNMQEAYNRARLGISLALED